jgi:hypothetical protein
MRWSGATYDTRETSAEDGLLMETSFDLLVWRRALADAAPLPSGREIYEWAERLTSAGEDAAAALLFDVAALHQGFSLQAIAIREGSASADLPFGNPSASAGDWTLHRAIAELRDLARKAAVAHCPRLTLPCTPRPSGRPDNLAGIGKPNNPAAMSDVIAAGGKLRTMLESEEADSASLAMLLESVVEAGRRYPTLDYRTFVQAPLALLVTAIAAIGLIDFALSTRDLWQAPLGSPGLFHHVARLDSGALGPYLGNVGRVARASRDVVDLARMARDFAIAAGDTEAEASAWLVLLSRGCRGGLLSEIVDDLGDFAEHGALLAILERAASRPAAAIDFAMVMRLRDTGLDNADYGLAARAQRIILRHRPNDRLEHVLLGSIEANGGEFARAEAIFRDWLKRAPDDQDMRRLLLAARSARLENFVIPYGFGSPADRRDTRLRRRGDAGSRPECRGERIRAVDLG